jgi:MATE family multidrug resistance protein
VSDDDAIRQEREPAAVARAEGASAMSRVRGELTELGRLAGPIILGFAGNQLLGIVDTAMVGRLGAADLAGTAVGAGIFFAITCFGLGACLGIDPLLAQAVGAEEGARVEAIRRRAITLTFWLAPPIMLALAVMPLLLARFGVEGPTTRAASRFLWGRLPSVLPFLLFAVYRAYLQSRKATSSIVVASIVANVVNFGANLLLIFGDGSLVRMGLPAVGLPALGVLGSGLASSLAQTAMLLVVLFAARKVEPLPGEGDTAVTHRSILRIGLPIGLTLTAEVGAFAIAGVLAARLGPHAAAGHQIAITLASMTFVVTLGLGAATTVRIGHAVGRRDTPQARLTGLVGFAASAAFMSLTALGFVLFARPLAGLLSDKPDVLAAAVPLIHIAAFFQISDGAQAVGAGALRGIGDTRFIQWANVAGHYLVGLPLAALLAFAAGKAERGLWWGLSAGLTAVALALFVRFHRLSRGELERVR